MGKIISYTEAALVGENSIVKVGCFDWLHIGHIKMFQRCKLISDKLIVLVGSDKVIEGIKSKPVFDEISRAETVAALSDVDYVIILNEENHEKILSIIKPKYYHVPSDDRWLEEKKDMTNRLSIEMIIDNNSVINGFEPHSGDLKEYYVSNR